MREIKYQIGKQGLTEGVVESLKTAFKHHKIIRISVLKSSGRDRNSILDLAKEISDKVSGGKYVHKVIGFTIIMRRKGESPESKEPTHKNVSNKRFIPRFNAARNRIIKRKTFK